MTIYYSACKYFDSDEGGSTKGVCSVYGGLICGWVMMSSVDVVDVVENMEFKEEGHEGEVGGMKGLWRGQKG